MINVEYLAITAIFGTGFYLGFKLKAGIIALSEYLRDRREN